MKHTEINTIEELKEALYYNEVYHFVFRKLDFSSLEERLEGKTFRDCIFIECYLSEKFYEKVKARNVILPSLGIPFRIPSHLYTARDLYDTYKIGDPDTWDTTYDQRIYRHYMLNGKEVTADTDIKESLGRVIHDHAIHECLHAFIAGYEEKKVVGVMGGHAILRTQESYRKIVTISKELTERCYLMISGGGPGAMEATHLGAWMAGRSMEEVEDAISILSEAPSFKERMWLDTAFRVMEKYPHGNYCSLGIPTFLYGHEPAAPFATHIAKYFDNSVREDIILTIAKGGIIYTPGSAGTMQEIFQDANQNHYKSLGYASPMIFMGRKYWTSDMPVYPLFQAMMANGNYKNLILSLVDTESEVIDSVLSFSSAK